MVHLKYKPVPQELAQGITLLQHINKNNAALQYIELKVIKMTSGSKFQESLGKQEVCIVALTGKIKVTDGEQTFKTIGTRKNVFEKIPTDSVYISIEQMFDITAITEATVILCYSPSDKKKTTTLIKASDNTIERRGKYQNKRLVHNILPDTSPIADRLLVVEVFTDGGNWSSYPPHKHDQDNLPLESKLEETYYHEMNPRQGFVFQRVYTDDRLLDETMAIENGDVVVVPKGYHPVGVPDGYDSYYLNVMAGPTRKWQFHNDPDHEWILNRE
ncbi:5-deoxy-glucuronate isomerase [Enterococcus ureilyticus]|uniref:5-deoxy-glucuronate isomerase n=1 Tax=Enterococcus ureilyticus TaxID=1131292 RepID=A0A1E5H991_9ENTE|nr:5-deoxy-glucuronate isomerase [Enterococcus ureilyticus]MBM7687563.1 5-deoxy-glucuronate isomerase [Enterococcus ureilyticus]OEG21395.1 5-deoxy-glucuronate isomerase [Enterococcus ureilyticus]